MELACQYLYTGHLWVDHTQALPGMPTTLKPRRLSWLLREAKAFEWWACHAVYRYDLPKGGRYTGIGRLAPSSQTYIRLNKYLVKQVSAYQNMYRKEQGPCCWACHEILPARLVRNFLKLCFYKVWPGWGAKPWSFSLILTNINSPYHSAWGDFYSCKKYL